MFDEIGYWTEVKLQIIKEYASAYSRILSGQTRPKFYHIYIDAFAGPGYHLSRASGKFVPGSPVNALAVVPPFREYHFIDLDGEKVEELKKLFGDRPEVKIFRGDCNKILLGEIFPNVSFEQYRRGLCLLDPYGLHLNWEVLHTAGQMRSIDMFLNFPIMDINRNVLWRDPERVDAESAKRLTAFWGDESWRTMAYRPSQTLFGLEEKKVDNEEIAQAFRQRLLDVAGFRRVAEPLPMRNKTGSVVYYLFFASQKPVAQNIIADIFAKYRKYGG